MTLRINDELNDTAKVGKKAVNVEGRFSNLIFIKLRRELTKVSHAAFQVSWLGSQQF